MDQIFSDPFFIWIALTARFGVRFGAARRRVFAYIYIHIRVTGESKPEES